jgi:glycosyltransferase involved in cell wall biosynthesis
LEPSKRRLRFVWNYLDWGGANVFLIAIIKRATSDWDIEVLLPIGSSDDILDMITWVGVRYRFIDACLDKAPAPTIKRKLQRQWRRIRAEIATYRQLKQEPLKDLVVHCELPPWQSWIFYWLLTRKGAKAFVTMHNALPERPRWRNLVWRSRLRFLSKRRGFHLLPSNQHAKESIRHWVDPKFFEAMPVTYTAVNPVEIAAANYVPPDRGEMRRQFNIPEEAFVVLTVGQFIDRKGRWTLLDAASKIVRANAPIHFVWVTQSLPDQEDQTHIGSYELNDRFQIIRSRDIGNRSHLLRFFCTADLFVLPSFIEGLPIALLEAMALGVPVISTDVFAIPEAVKDRETGLLVKAGDSEGLASRIIELFHDAALRERLAHAGRDHVLMHFDERLAADIAIAEYVRSLDE